MKRSDKSTLQTKLKIAVAFIEDIKNFDYCVSAVGYDKSVELILELANQALKDIEDVKGETP